MGLFWRDLPMLKGLDQMAAQVCSFVNGVAAGLGNDLSGIHIHNAVEIY